MLALTTRKPRIHIARGIADHAADLVIRHAAAFQSPPLQSPFGQHEKIGKSALVEVFRTGFRCIGHVVLMFHKHFFVAWRAVAKCVLGAGNKLIYNCAFALIQTALGMQGRLFLRPCLSYAAIGRSGKMENGKTENSANENAAMRPTGAGRA